MVARVTTKAIIFKHTIHGEIRYLLVRVEDIKVTIEDKTIKHILKYCIIGGWRTG